MNYGPYDYRAIVDATSIYSDLQEASGFDGVIEYHIQDSSDLYRPSYAGTVLNPSTAERDYIDLVFAELGRLTGALFVETEQFEDGVLNVFKVDSYLDGETVGLTSWDRGWESTDVSWQDEEGDLLTNYEKETILHESGHSVGLEHPNGDGYEPRFTTDITQMSYNPGDRLDEPGYRDLDQEALRKIWQPEATPTPTPTPTPLTPVPSLPLPESELESEEVVVPVDRKWAKGLLRMSGGDGVVNVHLDVDGDYKRKSKSVSRSHRSFYDDLFSEVEEVTGLSVENTGIDDADIIIHGTGRRLKVKRRRNFFDVNSGKLHSKALNDSRREVLASNVLTCFGLDFLGKKDDHVGDDSLMSYWRSDGGYDGLTVADQTALEGLWSSL